MYDVTHTGYDSEFRNVSIISRLVVTINSYLHISIILNMEGVKLSQEFGPL